MSSDFPWLSRAGEIDHLGILTEDFAAVRTLFGQHLGLEVGEQEDDERLGLSFMWVRGGDVALEFIAPLHPDGAASARLRERGPGVDHFALRVQSVTASLDWCRRRGIPLIDEVPRRGAHDSRIAFLAPEGAGGARVELVERPLEAVHSQA